MGKEEQAPLLEAVVQYSKAPRLPFHMPGHKAGRGAHPALRQAWGALWQWDLTEIQGLDDLGAPTEAIRQAQQRMAGYRGAGEAFFMTQGATVGLQAAVLACCGSGEELILPRHAHKSLWHGMVLAGCKPVWLPVIYEQATGIPLGVEPETLAKAVAEHPKAKAIVWVHPNPYGLTKGLKEAIAISKAAGIPIIVDGAHGGHLQALGQLPDPVALGADVVVESWHKTMGSLTQTAVLFQQNPKLPVAKYLRALHTSSPSYPLLASLDGARAFWQQHQQEIVATLRQQAQQVRKLLAAIPELALLELAGQDETRILLTSALGHSGYQVAACLRQAGVEPEMADQACVVLFLTLGDTTETIDGLLVSCRRVAQQLRALAADAIPNLPEMPLPRQKIRPQQAFQQKERLCLASQAVGKIASQAVVPYPPGIPLVGPGEEFTSEQIVWLQENLAKGGKAQGLAQLQPLALWVVDEDA